MPRLQLIENLPCGTGLHHLRFSAAESVAFNRAGQYTIIEQDSQQGFYALAGLPGADTVELLVKREGAIAEFLCALAIGAFIDCSPAQGNGFDLNAPAGPVHLFSMGSGLAPFRALILSADPELKNRLHLWQAAFEPAHLPFSAEMEQWEGDGVRIERCYDRPSVGPAYNVPDRLTQLAPDLKDALALWIGSPEFGAAVLKSAISLGLDPDRFRTNH